ncbi:sugar phosphate isomerase/epimerase family protein [Aquamicrobium sp. LC103]|uniref:sugar phosphate isomerase/epimerase family protein n=1 Tax=Aquamicrobium sp. LC103 TaxID=1120658 RepID=UPI00063E7D35|nr:sugar phosphate isomerase/epimerase family protein [Aquamicrobium sp. LC103]TKT76185.1 sugar phosphate isomerase/epimerase [Aquamicrobium sp. LC103]
MIPAVDSYSYHRFFGHHYPGLEADPGRRMTIAEFLDRVSEYGARGVSLESCFFDDFGERTIVALKAQLDRLGLERVWAWGHPRGLESGRSAEALDDLISHIRIAAALGASVMRICAGGRGSRPESWSEHKAGLIPMLRRAAAEAGEHGIVLALENHIDLYADEIVEIMETIASPALGVCLDTANNLRLFEHPLEVARKLAPWTRATHLKDIAAHRGDPRSFAFWPSVPLGDGAVEIDAILDLLERANYPGLLAIEIDLLHPFYAGEDEAVRLSLDRLRSRLDQAPPVLISR